MITHPALMHYIYIYICPALVVNTNIYIYLMYILAYYFLNIVLLLNDHYQMHHYL